jgi:thioredoxin-like negative regulator of GroEL
MIKPYLSQLATSGDWADVTFAVVDVDALESVAGAQGVTSMPTTMAFKGGQKLGEVIGTSKAAIADLLAKHR